MSSVIIESTDELVRRRGGLLVALGLSEGELRRRAVSRSLTSQEADALEELDEIGFLLGGE